MSFEFFKHISALGRFQKDLEENINWPQVHMINGQTRIVLPIDDGGRRIILNLFDMGEAAHWITNSEGVLLCKSIYAYEYQTKQNYNDWKVKKRGYVEVTVSAGHLWFKFDLKDGDYPHNEEYKIHYCNVPNRYQIIQYFNFHNVWAVENIAASLHAIFFAKASYDTRMIDMLRTQKLSTYIQLGRSDKSNLRFIMVDGSLWFTNEKLQLEHVQSDLMNLVNVKTMAWGNQIRVEVKNTKDEFSLSNDHWGIDIWRNGVTRIPSLVQNHIDDTMAGSLTDYIVDYHMKV